LCAFVPPQTTTSSLVKDTSPITDPYLINRAKLFAAALGSQEKDIVASMIKYPLKANFMNDNFVINGVSELKKYYDVLFDPAFIQAFSNSDIRSINVVPVSGDLSFQTESYAFVINSEGMIVEISNATMPVSAFSITPTPVWTATPSPEDCYNTAKTQDEINTCATQELEKTKDTLQALTNDLMPWLSDGSDGMTLVPYNQIDMLNKTIPEWEQTFQDHCNFEADLSSTKTSHTLIYTQCLTIQYKQLINKMRWYLCGGMGSCSASDRYKQVF
jgi:hypothetical protein